MVYFSRGQLLGMFALGLLLGNSAHALGLIEAYEAALQNDPGYRAAVYENEAGQQYRILGRSSLLPSVSVNYSRSKNNADITTLSAFGQRTEQRSYSSDSGAVQLRQPLISLEGVARYYQGVAQTDYSDAQFSMRHQDLIVRLVGAYADVKYAEERVALAHVQREANAEQRQVNRRLFEKGEGTKTDVLEVQAKYDMTEAQLIEEEDKLTDARNVLAAMVGREITVLDGLRDDFRVRPMEPAGFDAWKELALVKNPEIAAQGHAVEVAFQEIRKSWAGHVPRLDLVASVSDSSSDTINTYNQQAKINSIGIQLNMPLYGGGYTSAATRQSESNHKKAKAELEAKISQVLVDLRKYYNQVTNGERRIAAQQKAVESAGMLVDATQKSIRAGLRTNLDLLDARQQFFAAKRDLALARYEYLLGYLRLRQTAGMVGVADLQDVANYFVASR